MGIVPEEDITGYVVRQSFERSQGRFLVMPDTVSPSSKPGWAFPSGLKWLVSELGAGLPTLEGVISGHTRYQLYRPFLPVADQVALLNHHIGNGILGIAGRTGVAVGGRSRMAVCLGCIESDMKMHGYAVWRRLHLMPNIVACHIHQAPLYVFCPMCESGHRRTRANWRPKSECVCGGPLTPVAKLNSVELKASTAIARMSDQILRGTAGADITSLSITQALSHYFGKGDAAHRRLIEAVNDSLGTRMMAALGIGDRTVRRLLGRRDPGPIRNPIQNIAALYSTFGGLDKFSAELSAAMQRKEADLASEARLDPKVRERGKNRRLKGKKYRDWIDQLPDKDLGDLRDSSRRWLLNIMVKIPGISRTALRPQPGSYPALRFLLHIDNDWFDDLLPPSQSHRRASTELALLNEIARLTEKIKSRYETSLKLQPWRRITKTFLLAGAPSETRSTKAIESDVVRASLSAYTESPATYRKRLIDMVCSAFRYRASSHTLGDARTYEGIKDRACRRRLREARIWLHQNEN